MVTTERKSESMVVVKEGVEENHARYPMNVKRGAGEWHIRTKRVKYVLIAR